MRTELPRSTPEAQGIPSAAVHAFLDAMGQTNLELHGLMVLRHGHVVAEGWWKPYRPDLRHMLFSLSKSFTSTAVGFAVTEGLLTVEDRLIDYFPEYKDTLDPLWEKLKLKHLLMMGTGHQTDTMDYIMNNPNGNWAEGFFQTPLVFEPGTHFLYNTGATYMLSAVVQKVTGQRLLDYLTPRLFQPLGIESPLWEQSPQGIDAGGFGLAIHTEDIARFGQFLLQRGQWQGKQLLPAAWIDEATAKHIENGPNEGADWAMGYGYQFWRCQPAGVYRGDGAFGQFCIVSPSQGLVIAINSGLGDMQKVMTNLWTHLLPALTDPLPEDPAASAALQARLNGLHYDPPAACRLPERESAIAGRRYAFQPNDLGYRAMTFAFAPEGCTVTAETEKGSFDLLLGSDQWAIGRDEGFVTVPLGPDGTLAETAAAFAWQDDRLVLILRRIESPFVLTVTVTFDGDTLTLDARSNTSFGPTEQPMLTATAQ